MSVLSGSSVVADSVFVHPVVFGSSAFWSLFCYAIFIVSFVVLQSS